MAEEPIREEFERQQAIKSALFKAVADAYSFVHGQEEIRLLAARTFGAILQSRIDEIRGPGPLPSRLEEVDKVKEAFEQAIREMEEEADDA